MKIKLFFLMMLSSLAVGGLAQSGRRIKNSPPPAAPDSLPQVQETQSSTDIKEQNAVGYSESSPNPSRLLVPGGERNKNSKKDKKKDAAKTTPPPTASAEDEDTIKVETNLVTIPVSVSDRNGFFIGNLHQPEFKIYDNGVEQKVEYFGTSDKPFTVVLLIDVSPSTSFKIEEIQAAANAFVEQLMPQDQVMVIEFDSSVHVLTEATGDRDKIKKAISRTGFGDGTSLYEGVSFSINKRLDKIQGRKAIVLFTDGVDTTSNSASFESTIRDAEESDAVVFPIYYNTFLNAIGIGGGGGVMSTPPMIGGGGIGGGQSTAGASADYARGRAYLNELAAATGGKLYRAESTPGGLSNAFESIADELRRQYTLGYYPSAVGANGERRQIKVRVERPKLIIRTRDSYIVGTNAGS